MTAPPEAQKWVNVHKEVAQVSDDDYGNVHFDSLEFDIDDDYYIYSVEAEYTGSTQQGEPHWVFSMIGGESIDAGAAQLIGKSGHLSLDFMYQNMYNVAINITFACRPKVQVLLDWRLEVWNQIRQAAEEQYNKSLQIYQERRAELVQQIADYDALTLRRMEQEEIMKGVLRWLLGPEFDLVPFDLASLFGPDTNDPDAHDVLDPNRLTDAEWLAVMEHGEFIKYIHNAIEWENVLYFTYPYFWDDTALWQFKKFLYHPDPTHRTFLRSGAARVVLTIRPGFEPSFTSLVESGAFEGLPGPHPYVTIAQEIQNFANTNYPGFPPANPEQDARPLLYLEQRRVWREMQYVIQLLNAHKAATGEFPSDNGTQTVPAAAPYLDAYIDGRLQRQRLQHPGEPAAARARPDDARRRTAADVHRRAGRRPRLGQRLLLPVPRRHGRLRPHLIRRRRPAGRDRQGRRHLRELRGVADVDVVRVHADQRARHRDHDEPAKRRSATAEPGDRVILTDHQLNAIVLGRRRARRRRADVDVQRAARPGRSAQDGNSQLVVKNVAGLTAEQLRTLAAAAPGRISFDLTS